MIKFIGPSSIFDIASPFYSLVQFAATRSGYEGVKRYNADNEYLTVYDVDLVQSKFDLDTLDSWVLSGGEIHGYPVYIKMSGAKYTGNVPEGIVNRSSVDDQGQAYTRTWAEWRDATHRSRQMADGSWVVPGNSWGYELPASQIKILNDAAGYTVLLASEYKALLVAEEGE